MQPIANAVSRAQQVYMSIRDSICDCTLEPGKHLVQEELASVLGVSRQPIQQAMLLLKSDGLVVESGARGLYVAPLEPEGIWNHYQIRLAMDQLAAQLVAEKARESEIYRSRLRSEGNRILDEGEKARTGGSAAEAVGHDVCFHSFLYERSGNRLIAPTAEPHWNFLRRVMIAVLLHADRGPIVWKQHHDILGALVEGDLEESHRLVTAHIEGAHRALTSALSLRLPSSTQLAAG